MIEHILDIINNPNFKDFQKYIDILAETGEFSKALVDIEIEIIKSLDDSKISNYEMQLIGIKAFNIIKMLIRQVSNDNQAFLWRRKIFSFYLITS